MSEDDAQRAWEREMEMAMEGRGRTRSRSIVGESQDRPEDVRDGSERRRSCSFTSGPPPRGTSDDQNDNAGGEEDEDVAKRAASMSRMYLAGSKPVDPSHVKQSSTKVEVAQPTGALSAKTLDLLSEGLHQSTVSPKKDEIDGLTEAELAEKEMEEEEETKMKVEKSSRNTLTSRASSFTSKIFSKSMPRFSMAGKKEAVPAKPKLEVPAVEKEVKPPAAPITKSSAKKHKLKLLLLGDSGVGKTSLMRVFSGDSFSESMLATAGVDFKLRHFQIEEEDITLQIWDTAGQERFHRITATYYKGANGIVLVYDVSDRKSFDNVGYWMNNIQQYSSPNIPGMLLVGNKIDLPNRVVGSEEGRKTAQQYNCRFLETSAKTAENTMDALETIARDAFLMSINPSMTQADLIQSEKTKTKENCTIQ